MNINKYNELNYVNKPSLDKVFHGLGGYMNEAFVICSTISSSSLKGKVPLKLLKMWHRCKYGNTCIRFTFV